ncbi:MAG: glycosyltransferase family 39 protein [Candidatus Latescibacterota bacterium]|nr:MAG: glycosyltransferase family 39 protein [Candidatus Latescibacterota bacterium]
MRQSLWIVLGLVASTLALRLYGLDWGLPQVYEEAYPFKKSWPMWGWGDDQPFDLNPHFFNYPSFYFYTQFVGQGLLFLILRAAGAIESVLDYRVLYALDKTSFYVMGRSITVLFATATVLVTFLVGRRVRGVSAGAIAAFLVAVNEVHIRKSQVIEVDVPLTLLVMCTLLFALRILDDPRTRNYVLAGVFAGLATSTKYSGVLLPLAILVAHVAAAPRPDAKPARAERRAQRRGRRAPPASPAPPGSISRVLRSLTSRRLLLGAAAYVTALFLTSPYILLDFDAFWVGFNYERLHMKVGHFGLDESPAIVYYARVLTDSLLGWPLALVSLAAFVYYVLWRRHAWALVLTIFPAVYVALISSFSMKAERYILPLMPIACVLAGAFVQEMLSRRLARPVVRTAAAAVITLLLAAPSFVAYARGLPRLRGDTRTLAREWIETNVPSGSYVVSETYGPEPLSVIELSNMAAEVREHISEAISETRIYAMLPIPMLQVRPELMSVFYDLDLYDDVADYIVTSSSVSSRYRKDPEKFHQQIAFYDELEERYELAREFGPQDGSGPRLKIYRNPRRTTHFSQRRDVPPPRFDLAKAQETLPTVVGRHYQRYAVNLEMYGFYTQGAASYLLAWNVTHIDSHPDREQLRNLATGAVRCYLQAGLRQEAMQVIRGILEAEKDPAGVQYWRNLLRRLQASPP